MTLKQALWEIVRDENIIITNQNIDWLLDRAEKRANDNTDKNKLKGSILERKEKLDKLGESENKSNEELFKQALVEGVNRCIDKAIEEEKQIEQIEEMANDIKIAHDEQKYLTSDKSIKAIAEYLYNAGYRKQSEWIRVEDMLPEKEGAYLVYTKYGWVALDEFKLWEDDDMDGGYWIDTEELVTHWMPLPEAPKMKGGEE